MEKETKYNQGMRASEIEQFKLDTADVGTTRDVEVVCTGVGEIDWVSAWGA